MGAYDEELARRADAAAFWASLRLAQGLQVRCCDQCDDDGCCLAGCVERVVYSRKDARYVALNPRPGDSLGAAMRSLATHKDAAVRRAVEDAFVVNEGIDPMHCDFMDEYDRGRQQLIAAGWKEHKAGPEWIKRQAEVETGFQRRNRADSGADKSRRELAYELAVIRMTTAVSRGRSRPKTYRR